MQHGNPWGCIDRQVIRLNSCKAGNETALHHGLSRTEMLADNELLSLRFGTNGLTSLLPTAADGCSELQPPLKARRQGQTK